MAKIYLVKYNPPRLRIMSVELLKETDKQLHIDQNSAKCVWRTDKSGYTPWLAARLSRERENAFYMLPDATAFAKTLIEKEIKIAERSIGGFKEQLADLELFERGEGEKENAH